MNLFKNKGITQRIHRAMLAPALLTLCAMSVALFYVTYSSSTASFDEQAESQAYYLSAAVEYGLILDSLDLMMPSVQRVLDEGSVVRIVVTNAEKQIVLDKQSALYDADNVSRYVVFTKNILSQGVDIGLDVEDIDADVAITEKHLGEVTVHVTQDRLWINIARSFAYILLFTVLVVVLIQRLSLRIGNSLVKPITTVIDAIRQLKKGNYDHRVTRFDNVELDNLSNNLNELAQALRFYTDENKQQLITITQAREEAERANLSKSQFLAMLSHEIRNPVGAVNLMLHGLEDIVKDEMAQQLVRASLESISPLSVILDDLIDFSKLEYSDIEIEAQPFNVNAMLQSLMHAFEVQPSSGIALDLKVFDKEQLETVSIISDGKRIRQIMSNLVGNALKFTQQGFVNIICRLAQPVSGSDELQANTLILEVTDSGVGIAPEHQQEMFEMFTQVHEGLTTRKFGGFGLGLSYCKVLVDKLNGSISVRSQLNQGATFTVEIPVEIKNNQGQSHTMLPEKKTSSEPKGLKVLIVEDDTRFSFAMKVLLARRNLAVDTVADTKSGWRLYNSGQYDVVIVDYWLPGETGLALGQKIREQEAETGRRAIMILQTADQDTKIEEMAVNSGFDFHLSKPYSPSELYQKIDAQINWLSSDSRSLFSPQGEWTLTDELVEK